MNEHTDDIYELKRWSFKTKNIENFTKALFLWLLLPVECFLNLFFYLKRFNNIIFRILVPSLIALIFFPSSKLLFCYLYDNCDLAGFIPVNKPLWSVYTGISKDELDSLKDNSSQLVLKYFSEKLSNQIIWSEEEIKSLVKEAGESTNVCGKELYSPLRLSLFGASLGPDIPCLVDVLGVDESVKRIKNHL